MVRGRLQRPLSPRSLTTAPNPSPWSRAQADDEEAKPTYAYEGARAPGATQEVTAGEEPKVLTQTVTLLGARHGEGTATFPNGDTYAGSFEDGARSGPGKYVYASPPPEEGEDPKPPVATYEGKWKAGEKDGVGIMEFASGAKYHGAFAAGKLEGQGTMYYPNGDLYTGDWVAGKKHGSGTYVFKATESKVAGTWADNTLVEGTFTDKFGNSYAGAFAADPSAAGYVAGGSFSLASGASAVLA